MRFRAEIKGAPMKGAKDAPVTIVQWSDFQCPFCSRVEPTINKVMDDYKGKVRVVWRDLPLPFHPNALPSAIAARAAGEQGKFWEMHDKLFADQAHEDRATFEKYAQELGLNMGKFKAALDAQKGKEAIEADAAAGGKIGAHGTPAFFVNGKFLSGAQPYEIVQGQDRRGAEDRRRDDRQGDAEGQGLRRPDEGRQDRGAGGAGRRPPRRGAEKTPEQDTTVYKVVGGDGPAKGSKNAPLQVVDLLRLPVPVLQAGRADAVAAGEGVRRQGAHGLEELPAAVPPQRRAGGRGGDGRRRPGEVLADARQAVREQHRARSRRAWRSTRRSWASTWPSSRPTSTPRSTRTRSQSDTKEGQAVGVNGTPAVFINGRKINGAYPWETFKKIADDELAKKKGKARRVQG